MAFPALTIDQIQGLADTLNAIDALVNTKAFQTELDALTTVVGTKAPQSDLDALSTVVNTKAAQSDLTTVTNTLNALVGSVAGKADQSDLDALAARVTALETPKVYSTAMRPDPTAFVAGTVIYDSDLFIPLWTDEVHWKDATGTNR